MIGRSIGLARCVSSLDSQNSFSVVFCSSVVSEKTGSSSAMPLEAMFTAVGFVGLSSLFFQIVFSLGSNPNLDKKSALLFIFAAMCAVVKLNCITESQAFHNGGGIIFV